MDLSTSSLTEPKENFERFGEEEDKSEEREDRDREGKVRKARRSTIDPPAGEGGPVNSNEGHRSPEDGIVLPDYNDQVREVERGALVGPEFKDQVRYSSRDSKAGRKEPPVSIDEDGLPFAQADLVSHLSDNGQNIPTVHVQNGQAAGAAPHTEVPEQGVCSKSKKRVLLWLMVSGVLLVAIVAGTVCGTGNCGSGTSNDTTSVNVPSRDAFSSAAREYISTVRLSNSSLEGNGAEVLALTWLAERDPLFLEFDPDTVDGQLRLRQRYALATLFESAGGSNWDTTTNWLETSECDWFGIGCGSNNEVESLELDAPIIDECCQGNGLVGSISVDLFLLTSLRVVDIGANQMTGTISSLIGQWSDLSTLSLAGNDFSGEIPPEFGTLTELNRVFLHNTNLSGNLTDLVCPWFRGSDLWAECDRVVCDCCTRCQ